MQIAYYIQGSDDESKPEEEDHQVTLRSPRHDDTCRYRVRKVVVTMIGWFPGFERE